MSTPPRNNHEIDYKVYGEELQFVEIELDPTETAIAESGAMMMMDDGITDGNHFWRWLCPTAYWLFG